MFAHTSSHDRRRGRYSILRSIFLSLYVPAAGLAVPGDTSACMLPRGRRERVSPAMQTHFGGVWWSLNMKELAVRSHCMQMIPGFVHAHQLCYLLLALNLYFSDRRPFMKLQHDCLTGSTFLRRQSRRAPFARRFLREGTKVSGCNSLQWSYVAFYIQTTAVSSF